MTSIEYFDPGDHVNPVKTVNFTYDNVGNLTGYSDGTTSATYGYDDLYRKISESVNYGPFTKTNAYGYLKNGLKETFTGPDNIVYGYLYDNNNQLTGVQIPNSGFVTIGEYNWNRPKSMILPGGTTKQFEYDPLMRVKQITAKDPGQNVLLNYQYSHDKVDNITEKATEHGEYSYDYDDLYRLFDVDNPDFDDEAFTYDGVGNRLTSEGVIGNWSYNTNNELSGYDDVSYVYDANGNMTKKTVGTIVTSYVYNIEDRLIEVWNGEVGNGSLTASYYYDPFGRRLWKEIGGVKTYFHYADEGLIAELDAAGSVTKSYGYKPGSTWTTDPLFMKVGSVYYFYHNDHIGTPQKMTAVNGAVVWSAKYSSFGKADVDPAFTITNNLRFPGQYEDQETGLHYNLLRYYDQEIGRYLKEDAIGILGGINLFAYTANNPVNYTDNLGLYYKGSWFREPYFENLNVEFTKITQPKNIKDKNPRKVKLAYLHFKASATVGFTVYCKEYDCNDKEIRYWYVHRDWTDEFPVKIPVKLKIISVKYVEAAIIAYNLAKATRKAYKYYNSILVQLLIEPTTYCYTFPNG